jgi:hypothetical protein
MRTQSRDNKQSEGKLAEINNRLDPFKGMMTQVARPDHSKGIAPAVVASPKIIHSNKR